MMIIISMTLLNRNPSMFLSTMGQTRTSSLEPHVRFRRVQTSIREGSPLVKLRIIARARTCVIFVAPVGGSYDVPRQ
jgi:hypothetical protein